MQNRQKFTLIGVVARGFMTAIIAALVISACTVQGVSDDDTRSTGKKPVAPGVVLTAFSVKKQDDAVNLISDFSSNVTAYTVCVPGYANQNGIFDISAKAPNGFLVAMADDDEDDNDENDTNVQELSETGDSVSVNIGLGVESKKKITVSTADGSKKTVYTITLLNKIMAASSTGTMTFDGSNEIHQFHGDTSSQATHTLTVKQDCTGKLLIVAGGGGGGASDTNDGGGGGGAGGLIYHDTYSFTAGNHTIKVGKYGNGGNGACGNKGNDSQFDSSTVKGGGYGGRGNLTSGNSSGKGGAGGSGGGGGAGGGSETCAGGSSEASGQGFAGGTSDTGTTGGGGGGANNAGTAPNGGAGKSYDITGSAYTYAAGGKGGVKAGSGSDGTNGVSFGDGGGGGSPPNSGGSAKKGGNGQSGIVIVRIPYVE